MENISLVLNLKLTEAVWRFCQSIPGWPQHLPSLSCCQLCLRRHGPLLAHLPPLLISSAGLLFFPPSSAASLWAIKPVLSCSGLSSQRPHRSMAHPNGLLPSPSPQCPVSAQPWPPIRVDLLRLGFFFPQNSAHTKYFFVNIQIVTPISFMAPSPSETCRQTVLAPSLIQRLHS